MEKVLEVAIIAAIVGNKIAVVGIAAWLVWALQTLFTDERWAKAYPFLDSVLVRAGVALVAFGFALDALTLYTPGVSEVLMNMGLVFLLFKFRHQYKRNQGGMHRLVEIFKGKHNQKHEI